MITANELARRHRRIVNAGWSCEEFAAGFLKWSRLWEASCKLRRQKADTEALERTK